MTPLPPLTVEQIGALPVGEVVVDRHGDGWVAAGDGVFITTIFTARLSAKDLVNKCGPITMLAPRRRSDNNATGDHPHAAPDLPDGSAPRPPSERFPVGEYIADELVERGWTINDLCEHSGLPVGTVAHLMDGGSVTPAVSAALADVFGTTPDLWMALQTHFDRRSDHQPAETERVATRRRRR